MSDQDPIRPHDEGDEEEGAGDSWLNKDYLYYAVLVILVILVFVLIPLFE